MSFPGIARCLELKQLESDSFVNACPPWLPPGAQGIYGGTLIAHCLVAAQWTVPHKFVPSSMHCSFLVGDGPDKDITYRVERLGEEETATPVRTVRAHQNDRCIFEASLSFKIEGQDGETFFDRSETNKPVFDLPDANDEKDITGGGLDNVCPYVCSKVGVQRSEDGLPEKARTWQKVKTRDVIHQDQGSLLHTAALAYMTDNYFLPTTSRVRNILWSREPEMERTDGCSGSFHPFSRFYGLPSG